MKRFTIIILSALLVCLSLAGCAEDSGADLTEDTSAEVIETESFKSEESGKQSEETAEALTETKPPETISECAPNSTPLDTVQEPATTQPPTTTAAAATTAATTAAAAENTLPPETETETSPHDSETDTAKDETTSDPPNESVAFYPIEAPSFFERETIETITNPPPISSTAIIEPPPRELY